MAESAAQAERRRQRVAGAFHVASALIRTWGESHPQIGDRPNATGLAAEAVRITDEILRKLEETSQ